MSLTPFSLDSRRDIDCFTLNEGHNRFFIIWPFAKLATEALQLALLAQRVHSLDLHTEDAFDSFFDLWLGRINANFKSNLVVLGTQGLFFSLNWAQQRIEMRGFC